MFLYLSFQLLINRKMEAIKCLANRKLKPRQSSEKSSFNNGKGEVKLIPSFPTKITKQFKRDLVSIIFFFLPVDLDSDVLPCSFVPGNHQVCSEKKEKCYYEKPELGYCFFLLVLTKLGTVISQATQAPGKNCLLC